MSESAYPLRGPTCHIKSREFFVEPDSTVDLKRWPTKVQPAYKSEAQYKEILAAHIKDLSEQQELLYASNSYALLLIFQAMDAAGKDSVINHVMSGVNPQGCRVTSFKHPSAQELQHDFLWRSELNLCPSAAKLAYLIDPIMKRF
jgi:polyphosphate kinase 2 (PPK2 family)